MKKFLKENKWFLLGLTIVFLLCMLFPYTGDDWQWRSWPLSFETIKSLFTSVSINGRYVANIIVLLISKNMILKSIVISLVLNLIVEIIYHETKINRLYSWILIGLMPTDMFRQTIVWTSGFTNYVISTLLLLINILTIEKILSNKKTNINNIFLFILLFLSSFFIENLTIFLLLLTLVTNIIYLIKNKKINLKLIIAFIASFIGTILMFMQPCYSNVANKGETYRSIASNIKELIIKVSQNYITIKDFLALENIFLVLFIVVILFIYYKKQSKKNKFLTLSFSYLFLYSFYIISLKLVPVWNPLLSHTLLFNNLVTMLFLILLTTNIIILYKKHKDFKRFLLLILSIIGLIAPLSIVTPIGARNFFMIYILELFLSLSILKTLNIETKTNIILISLSLFILGYYANIYGYIEYVSEQRLDYIKKQNLNQSTLIEVPYIPYNNYVWNADFTDLYNSTQFKLAYKINPEVKFVFYDYTYWYNNFYLNERK